MNPLSSGYPKRSSKAQFRFDFLTNFFNSNFDAKYKTGELMDIIFAEDDNIMNGSNIRSMMRMEII